MKVIFLICIGGMIFLLDLNFLMAHNSHPGPEAFVGAERPGVSTSMGDLPVRRFRHVRLGQDLLPLLRGGYPVGSRMVLNLFDNVQVECELVSYEKVTDELHLTRWKSLQDAYAMVTFSLHNQTVAGSFKLNDQGTFHLEYAGTDVYRIVQQDALNNPLCGLDQDAIESHTVESDDQAVTPHRPWLPTMEGDLPVREIDLLLAYTSEAKRGAGGEDAMRATAALYVEESNWVFENSEAPVRLNLVHLVETTHKESGYVDIEYDRLRGAIGSNLDELRALRELHGADLVTLIVERSNDYLGSGTIPTTLENAPDRAYNVNLRMGLPWGYLMTHEIGHNFGCYHDRDNTGAKPPFFDDSYGYRFVAEGVPYVTVMGYWPGYYIPHFSNPDVLYHGEATGLPLTDRFSAGNIHALTFWSEKISQYRDSEHQVFFENTRYEVEESSGFVDLKLQRTPDPITQLSVRLDIVSGTADPEIDYVFSSERLIFEFDQNSKTLRIPILDDDLLEGDETFRISIIQLGKRGRTDYVVGEYSEALIVIKDDDSGVGFTSSREQVSESESGLQIAVKRFGDISQRVVVSFETSAESALEGSDFYPTNGSVVFEAGEEMAVIQLAVPDDYEFETDETFYVHLDAPTGTVLHETLSRMEVLIKDDDRPGAFVPHAYDGETPNNIVWCVSRSKAGHVLIGGEFSEVGGESIPLIARYGLDGRLDRTFRVPELNGIRVYVIKEQPDGKILVGGEIWLENSVQSGLVRLQPDGTIDPDFRFSPGFDGQVRAVDLQSDGSIIVAGSFYHFNSHARNHLVRLTSDGGWDPSFKLRLGKDYPPTSMVVLPDDRILLGGIEGLPMRNAVDHLQRLLPDGALDPEWTSSSKPDNRVNGFHIERDGSVYLLGRFTRIGRHPSPNVARLLPDGKPDTSFSTGRGMDANADYILSMVVQKDGKVIVAGGFSEWAKQSRKGIARLNADGSPDESFDIQDGPSGWPLGLIQHPDGSFIIGGEFVEIGGVTAPYLARIYSEGISPYLTPPVLEGGTIKMSVVGHSSRQYDLQGSSDLAGWKTVFPLETKEENTVVVFDVNKLDASKFFRVIENKKHD